MVGSLTETGSLIIRKGISPAIPGHCDNEETRVSRTSQTTHSAGARTPTTNGGRQTSSRRQVRVGQSQMTTRGTFRRSGPKSA